MGHPELHDLLDTTLLSIDQIIITEDNQHEFIMDDSFVIHRKEGLVQILNDNNKTVIRKIQGISDLKLWDEFDGAQVNVRLKEICKLKDPRAVKVITSYLQGSNYFFGSKCLDANRNFIIGFCHGFDELILQNESEFDALLLKYPEKVSVMSLDTL